MVYKIKIETFEGPLDLLLQLIEQEEMDITQIALAGVTEQYLGYINDSPDILTEELADFLVVAAKLLLIKSKSLLPNLEIDDEEAIDLERQLKIYKEFHDASKVLHKMINKKHFLFSREKAAVSMDKIFNPPEDLTTTKLQELFADVLSGLEPWINLPTEVIKKTISIRERIGNIREMITHEANMSFKALLKTAKDKTEVIVTFLAILELVKQKTVAVVQENLFDEIHVQKINEEDQKTDIE
ncbi:MAG: segregation and condensation protein A [Candidatus Kerfeldbacteria bacterium]